MEPERVRAALETLDTIALLLDRIPPAPWHVERVEYTQGGAPMCSMLVLSGDHVICRADTKLGKEDQVAFGFIAASRAAVPAIIEVMREMLELDLKRQG